MYDYVLQLGFENKTKTTVQELKRYLKEHKIEDKERVWLPHITIDLYNCKNQEQFIEKVEMIVRNIQPIKLQFKNLNDFEKETLYIEPYNKTKLIKIKEMCNKELREYRLEKRKDMIYKPHVTLCTNENIEEAYELAIKKFKSFEGKIIYLWIYNQKQELIKEYHLR